MGWGAIAGFAGKALGVAGRAAGKYGAAAMAYKGVRDTNKTRIQEAQRNRDFQERMSNTSWQRGVKDMTDAGLNPALAYGQGGASSSGGSMASGLESPEGAAVSSALADRLQKEQISQVREVTRGLREEHDLLYSSRGIPQMGERGKPTGGTIYGQPGHRETMQRIAEDSSTAQLAVLRAQLPQAASTAKAWTGWTGDAAAYLQLLRRSGGGQMIGSLSRLSRGR